MFRIVDPPPNFKQSASEWIYKVSPDSKNVRSMRNLPRRSLPNGSLRWKEERTKVTTSRGCRGAIKVETSNTSECVRDVVALSELPEIHTCDLKVHNLEKLRWPWDRSSGHDGFSCNLETSVNKKSHKSPVDFKMPWHYFSLKQYFFLLQIIII